MTNCLLCNDELNDQMKYYQVFCIKKLQLTVCKVCWNSFELISTAHCPQCWREGVDDSCSDCQNWSKSNYQVEHQSLFTYNPAMKSYFSRYKFEGDYLLRYVFSSLLKTTLKEFTDYIFVPIPISSERYFERGFNQVTGLLEAAGLPYQELLSKGKSQKQSSKNKKERLLTQQNFKCEYEGSLPEKILIIDDIYTTGVTLYQAYQCLKEAGAIEIKTFSLVR